MLLRSRPEGYGERLPRAQDVLLVIEIADSSVEQDLTIKSPRYARYGVPEFWILARQGARLIVLDQPSADGYQRHREYGADDVVSPNALPRVRVELRSLLAAR